VEKAGRVARALCGRIETAPNYRWSRYAKTATRPPSMPFSTTCYYYIIQAHNFFLFFSWISFIPLSRDEESPAACRE
ncbi:MAG: hypothetical protein WBM17_09080, partial [Anaerolineales bacterium]